MFRKCKSYHLLEDLKASTLITEALVKERKKKKRNHFKILRFLLCGVLDKGSLYNLESFHSVEVKALLYTNLEASTQSGGFYPTNEFAQ